MRYAVLILLNMPIVILALVNILTQYKMKLIGVRRFRHQILLWLFIMSILIASFPVYNLLGGKPVLDSGELSSFDIAQTTVLIYLIYIINNLRRKIERGERIVRDLHQEISIILSTKHGEG